jgi:hypothetical protein
MWNQCHGADPKNNAFMKQKSSENIDLQLTNTKDTQHRKQTANRLSHDRCWAQETGEKIVNIAISNAYVRLCDFWQRKHHFQGHRECQLAENCCNLTVEFSK